MRLKLETQSGRAGLNFETIVSKEQEIAQTLRELAIKDSEYVSLQQVTVTGLEATQQFIPDRATLIEYFVMNEEVIAFVISRRTATVVRRLTEATYVRKLHNRLLFQFDSFLLGPEFIGAHSEQVSNATAHYLQALHGALIEPLLPEITTPHIIIVPHGCLHSLPFHAFSDGSSYLIDHFEVTYAPSASTLRYCLEKPVVTEAPPVIVGVADANAPLVEMEVAALRDIFPDAVVICGDRANREAFTRAARNALFVHIATHANFRRDNPLFSSFKLAEGYVTALDLFSMTCSTNMVALSGCHSGLGQVVDSDDVLGLMRGFFYAGTRSILMSLWAVSDESTVLLMKTFYSEWQRGASKAKAIQVAMRTVRLRYTNPFYWAPFVVVGTP
jgi:CHAT domain-containing protein